MPFGLCNTPTMFMWLINDVLWPFIEDFILMYLDDIMIFLTSWEKHMEHVKKVLEVLKQHRLWLNCKKYEFGRTSLIYICFMVENGELHIGPDNVRVIQEWPTWFTTEVRSFIGACQYLRKFIRNLLVLASPLQTLMKANNKFEWTKKWKDTF